MGIVDVIILVCILFGAVIGFKRGFTKELVSCLGFLLAVIVAFSLKNYVSAFLYEHLPFFGFGGVFKGITVLNIAVYEIIGFLIVLAVLMLLVRLLLFATGLFETVLKFTIILGIPSKIMGAIIGLLEQFVVVFIILYILNLPFFHIPLLQESKWKDKILNSTPVLSSMIDKSIKVVDEFADLKEKYETTSNANQFNLETLDLFLKYKVISLESADRLVEKNKLKIDNVESVLCKYRKVDQNGISSCERE